MLWEFPVLVEVPRLVDVPRDSEFPVLVELPLLVDIPVDVELPVLVADLLDDDEELLELLPLREFLPLFLPSLLKSPMMV